MFMGEYRHNIDSKGRLIIPAKFREQLGNRFIVTRGLDGCLFGYTESEWQKVQDEVNKLPFNKRDARTFARLFFSAATECEIDKQGRINLPDPLIKYAKLTKNCVLTGVSKRFEIWDAKKWDDYNDQAQDDFNDIAENLLDF
ncbi:cell division/cell wall cluster transcriptional repressor MraZ [Fructilactobacillus lindneri]|uniref:Transcriptional regulator MraZ n=1 Tax=Fructilactobacillus lindneri TaxID=53444 RepID=A0AB33BBD2_9LACO|nr:division/cell wall cluster transcriptional repressor MraZ [Fructilactobacillus lindneri]ANZ58002.1 division/cell wall cluster transcriptional repressor MraZ [Fructilactobacillus lindneri]ANZ59272.1 division/cell wall cluster transcriptional repressor MraZ [Fructilactobacillus lindneri]POG98891.1 cell division/cell wall cluster transcriptional repressor MraZ [Fructilactobacillus lindneri]POH00148.1 cell division/cell wall cluster transcriptional repressor MraZ [Fructilactobacillus lindneri]P